MQFSKKKNHTHIICSEISLNSINDIQYSKYLMIVDRLGIQKSIKSKKFVRT